MTHSIRSWAIIVALAVAANFTFHEVTEPSSTDQRRQDDVGHVARSQSWQPTELQASSPMVTGRTAANQPSLQYAGSTLWNTFIDVVVQDTIAYCAMGAGLAILNVSDAASPELLSRLYLPGQSGRDLEIRDSLIYIVRGTGGLKIINVSDPLQPRIIGEYPFQVGWDLELSGNLLYVSEFEKFTILDVSDPTNPVFVAQSPGNVSRAYATAAYGNYLYVCAGPDGVYVVDVSTPTSPTLAHAFPGFTVANHLEVSDGVLYVSSETTGSVGIWDLANPALPVSIATRITGPFDEFEIRDSILYSVGGNGIVIADMFNPPVFPDTDVRWDSLISPIGMALTDSLIFVTDATTGLTITTHSGAEAMPATMGEYPAAMNIERVVATGDMAVFVDHVTFPYSLEEWRLRFVDLTDPTSPLHVGSYVSPGYINDVEALGSYVYVAVYSLGLYILDITDPTQPQVEATFGGIQAVDMVIDGGLLYTTGADGLSIYDLSDPVAPSFLGSAGNVGATYSLCKGGEFVYMMTDSTQFQVVDVSDPMDPVLSGSLATGQMLVEQVAGDHVYVVNNAYLKIINVANPAAPFVEGTFTTPLRVRSAVVVGSYAYIADSWLASLEISAIRIVDVSNPALPVLIGSYPTTGFAWDLALTNGHLLVADYREGLVLSLHIGRGDINEDGRVTLTDVVYLINYLYNNGPPPPQGVDAADFNCNGTVDMIDLIYMANYLLKGGPPPC